MIAITFALPAESSGLLRKLTSKRQVPGNSDIAHGKIGTREVAIFHTGVGREICGRRIREFLDTVQPALLISSGFAGAVTEELAVGNLIVATNYSDPRLVAAVFEGGDSATPRAGSRELAPPSPGRLNVHHVKLFTASSIVDSPEERSRTARENGAQAVDMETEVISQACERRGIPLLSFRVISDTPAASLPLPPGILFDLQRQRTPAGRLALFLLVHPSSVPRLIRFSTEISRARAGLTGAIADLLESKSLLG